MIWPGMGDPAKRRKTLKFLAVTAVIAISVGLASTLVQSYIGAGDPLKACIEYDDGRDFVDAGAIHDRNIAYKVTATVEIIVDGTEVPIPAGIGREAEICHRSIYTATDDGTIHAEWLKEHPFEIGHFLWLWEFPLREMEQSKSAIYVNGAESPHFINHPLQDGLHYRGEFTTKAHDTSKDTDFLPEN